MEPEPAMVDLATDHKLHRWIVTNNVENSFSSVLLGF